MCSGCHRILFISMKIACIETSESLQKSIQPHRHVRCGWGGGGDLQVCRAYFMAVQKIPKLSLTHPSIDLHCTLELLPLIYVSHVIRRMLTTFPGSKTYFSHLDISPGSDHLYTHGKKIVQAIAEGAQNISRLTETLAPLQTLHAYLLRIDPSNFKVSAPI